MKKLFSYQSKITFPRTFSVLIFLLAISTACSLLVPDPSDGLDALRSQDYKITYVSPVWRDLESQDADRAFIHRETKSIIISNSVCRKYKDSPLDILSHSIFAEVQNFKYKKSEVQYFDRDAQWVTGEGYLDGKNVFLQGLFFKRNHCNYDLVLISPLKRYNHVEKDFKELINSIRFSD